MWRHFLKISFTVSLRVVYGAKCSTDVLQLLSSLKKKENSCILKYTAFGEYLNGTS